MTIDIDNVIEIKMEKFVITREHVRKKIIPFVAWERYINARV